MAVTLEDFLEKTGAELCGDRLILGTMAERRVVGDITDGVFTLNDAGKEVMAGLEAAVEEEKVAAAKPKSEPKHKAANKAAETTDAAN